MHLLHNPIDNLILLTQNLGNHMILSYLLNFIMIIIIIAIVVAIEKFDYDYYFN